MTRGKAHGFLQKARQVLWLRKTLLTSPLAKSPRLMSAPVAHSHTHIPGPSNLPVIGAVWQYLSGGPFYHTDMNEAVKTLNKKYGDVVLERAGPTFNVVRLFNPNHFAEVYKAEGDFPVRRFFHFLHLYNELHNEGVQGLFTSQDFEWRRLRNETQDAVNATVGGYERDTLVIANDFVERIAKTASQSGEAIDLLPEIKSYVIGAAGRLCYGVRCESLGGDDECIQLVKTACQASEMIHDAFQVSPVYRYIPTPSFNRYTKTETHLRKVSQQLIETPMDDNDQAKRSRNFVGQLHSSYLSDREIRTLVTELFTGNSSLTMCYLTFMLYAIGKNDRVQETLYNELKDITDDDLTSGSLRSMPYFAAVEKEVLRMYPVVPGVERVLRHDIVVDDYLLPTGTTVVIQCDLAGKDPRFVDNPDDFKPERWMDNSEGRILLPLLSLPFGHGPRSCPGREMAFQQVGIAVTKLLQRFRISHNDAPLKIILKLANVPVGPIRFRITER